MQRNTNSRGNVKLDQKLREKNWSKNAAHLPVFDSVNCTQKTRML